MRRVEPGHHHAALRPPSVATGAENAWRQAHLEAYLLELDRAPKAIGPVAQDRCHQRMVGDHQDVAAGSAQVEHCPELAAPLLELQVKALGLDLEHVAQPGQATRARQVVDAAQRGGGGTVGVNHGHRESPVGAAPSARGWVVAPAAAGLR